MLELKDLTVGYRKKTVLNELSVSFESGKLTSLVGANGCGKTTLLKSIINVVRPSSGEIFIDGIPVSQMDRNKIAKKAAYLSQGRSVPDMTVFEMVLHGRFPYLSYPKRYSENDKTAARGAIERLGLTPHADTPLYALSGGMRQNAYLAMALAQDTDYILLDEPTTYLDVTHQLELMRILRELAHSGKGIIAVMHDLPMAFSFSDTITVIDGQKAAAQGSPTELCDSPLISDIFGVRMKCLHRDGSKRPSFLYDI